MNGAIVEGVELLSFQALWFVVAGFILGFATSTLWEWLYYRGKRHGSVAPAPAAVDLLRTDDLPAIPDEVIEEQQAAPWQVPYRSPRVYLEIEQSPPAPLPVVPAQPAPDPAAPLLSAEQPAPRTAQSEPKVPRLNPATLAALQAAVADTPIVQMPASHVAGAQPFAGQGGAHTMVYTAPPTASPTVDDADQAANLLAPLATNSDSEQLGTAGGAAAAPLPPAAPTTSPLLRATATLQSVQPLRQAAVDPTDERDHPDDLALIKGVGEAYKRRLYGAGIYTWRQVAESDTETLRRITRAKPNANIGAWRQQAQELAEKFQRWQTTFRGPLDDFTRIDGIGAITADILYKAGICTYDQLAGALPDELAKIVPAPTVGDEIDFDGWINTATRLANAKRRPQGLLS